MRYAFAHTTARQAGSRRIGRCARCHAPVLCDEEHYGSEAALVHGACGTQSLTALPPTGGDAATPAIPAPGRTPVPTPRRPRRFATAGVIHRSRAVGTR